MPENTKERESWSDLENPTFERLRARAAMWEMAGRYLDDQDQLDLQALATLIYNKVATLEREAERVWFGKEESPSG